MFARGAMWRSEWYSMAMPTWSEILRLAAESHRDPRRVRAYLNRERVRKLTADAIDEAAKRLGLEHLLPGHPGPVKGRTPRRRKTAA